MPDSTAAMMNVDSSAPVTYSIKREFAGASVFLTGASGFVGSVVLEQLLRTTQVDRVYVLMRSRKGQGIQQRADALLQGPLFHKVRDSAGLLSKVKVVEGDITLPNLGMSAADREAITGSVNFIVHSAADIRLEVDIQDTLRANFQGTRQILGLASASRQLRALVHVSSAFANINMEPGSVVDERLYPLRHGSQTVDVEELAQELMGLSREEANSRAEVYKARWGFPNTYTLGKHMSEQLVTRFQDQQQLPVAIVRPSLIAVIAGEPYPGFVANWAGPAGVGAAMAAGMFDCLDSVAAQPMGVWDLVPADMVAANILAAAAALASGAAAGIAARTLAGSVCGSEEDAALVCGRRGRRGRAATTAAQQQQQLQLAQGAAGKQGGKQSGSGFGPFGPHLSDAAADIRAVVTPRRASLHAAPDVPGSTFSFATPSSPGSSTSSGGGSAARPAAPPSSSSSSSSSSSWSTATASRSAVRTEQRQRQPLLIVHAATSSTYPVLLMESWNYGVEFIETHPPPFKLMWGQLPRMTPQFEPSEPKMLAARARMAWKVWAAAQLLRLAGREREARKLCVSFDTFCVQNNAKTDRRLTFSTHALLALEAGLDPAEATEYLLVWRPMMAPAAAAASGLGGGIMRDHEEDGMMCHHYHAGALAGLAGSITWRRYIHTQLAAVYKGVFGVSVPPRTLKPAAAAAAAAAAAEGRAAPEPSEDDYIRHDYHHIR